VLTASFLFKRLFRYAYFLGGGGTSLNKKKLGKSCGPPPQIVFRTQQPGLDYATVPNVTATGKSHGVAMALMMVAKKAPEMLEVLQRIMI
jgi:hypothetical protein